MKCLPAAPMRATRPFTKTGSQTLQQLLQQKRGENFVRDKLKSQRVAKNNLPANNTRYEQRLLDQIGKLESSDNYNIIYGNEEKPLTSMTIKEVYDLQKKMKADGRGSTAVGRYQFLNNTLKEAVKDLGVGDNAIFNENLQDRLAKKRFLTRKMNDYLKGKITVEEFAANLSKEWAALPKDASNQSHHKGVLNNRALMQFNDFIKLLQDQ